MWIGVLGILATVVVAFATYKFGEKRGKAQRGEDFERHEELHRKTQEKIALELNKHGKAELERRVKPELSPNPEPEEIIWKTAETMANLPAEFYRPSGAQMPPVTGLHGGEWFYETPVGRDWFRPKKHPPVNLSSEAESDEES